MPDAMQCCRCGCDITDEDGGGWPDHDGLLCQMCWESQPGALPPPEFSPEWGKMWDQTPASDAQP